MAPTITVRCPKCKAKPGDPCVYFNTTWRWDHSTRKVVILHKEGEPTTRFHNERFNHAQKAAWQRDRAIIPIIPAGIKAVREYDRQEYYQMQEWLRDNWKILFIASSTH